MMAIRGMKYCLLCNPEDNGFKGKKGTRAIGKYHLESSPDQAFSGYIPICEHCCLATAKYFTIIPLKGKEDHQYFKLHSGIYEHSWDKVNLVTQNNFYDTWKCMKCGVETKTKIGGPDNKGCREEI